MNWLNIGLAAVSGALAALLASLIVRNPKEKRTSYLVVFVMCFAGLQALSQGLISPHLVRNRDRGLETALLESPLFKAIRQYEPNAYENLVRDLQEFTRRETQSRVAGSRIDDAEITGAVRGRIADIAQKRLPTASDRAVVSYMGVMVAEIRELRRHGGELCFRFLFPQQSTPFDGRKYFSKEMQEADIAALVQVISSSAENPQLLPSRSDVEASLEPIIAELVREHGNDLSMLQNPSASSVDKGKVCSMTIDLYSRVLRLPMQESSRVLRFMLAKT